MPDFPELFNQFQQTERTTIQVDTQGRLMLTPELEQAVRRIVREEMDKWMDELRMRFGASRAEFMRLETK